ncbi:MAG: type II secretion system protein [Candidatus Omnitrophica bacterium]|nr:type II secretion system protein [Candidatus Omnitrophota bacterium]
MNKSYNLRVKRSFTMLELLVVMVIIAVISGFAIPSFVNSRKKAEDREAIAMLTLIRAAEEVRRMEQGNYISCTNSVCNNDPDETPAGLGLDLSWGQPWTYTVSLTGGGFQATASGGGTGNWCINQNMQRPDTACP